MIQPHLVRDLRKQHDSIGMKRGELLGFAADEIERLREYAISLESSTPYADVIKAREETKVNWQAIHGVDP